MSDEWYTPEEIFNALGMTFDLDPCSPSTGAIVPATHKFVLPTDGLERSWFGQVWCNPPYSKPAPWVYKWLAHGNGMLLVINSKSKWYEQLWNHEKTAVVYPKPPKFILPDGRRMQQKYAVSLWAIGEECIESLRNSGLGKVR